MLTGPENTGLVTDMHRLGARARWTVPVGVAAVAGIVAAAAAVASAEASPSLPHRTASQLLADVAQASRQPLGPLTATIQETANLGLPSLPALSQQPGASSPLTSGTQSVRIWYRDAQHIRLAQDVQDGETDARLDGRTLWTWNSKTQTATRYTLPAHGSVLPGRSGNGAAGAGSLSSGSAAGDQPQTPQAFAEQLLTAVGPTSVVGVQNNVYVAGRAAYQLSLAPRSSKSLVGRVLIAIDASRHIPLRVEVFPRGSSSAALSFGFTSLTLGTPAASNFSFTPPPGAAVKKVNVTTGFQQALKQAGLLHLPLNLAGLGSGSVTAKLPSSVPLVRAGKASARSLPRIPKKDLASIKAQFARSLPKTMSAAERSKLIRQFDKQLAASQSKGRSMSDSQSETFTEPASSACGGWTAFAPLTSASSPACSAGQNEPRVIGSGWLSVVATPPSSEAANAVKQLLSGPSAAMPQGRASSGSSGSFNSSADSSTLTISPPGPDAAVLQALLRAGKRVSGSWGSGRLLQTRLLTVLVTSKGQILAGAVTPAVLYADVAADSR